MKLSKNSTLVFASVEEGKHILETRDDFIERLSPFDRSARLKTAEDVSQEAFLKHAAKSVLQWTDDEKAAIESAYQGIQKRFESLDLPFPEKVLLIKTSGEEDGHAAYTRSNAVVFPEDQILIVDADLQKSITHELFHVLSRANPELREQLYQMIGFVKCDEVDLPEKLASRKITNPDAPKNDHCIRLKVANKEHWAIPIIFSKSEKYDTSRGDEFYHNSKFQMLLVERNGATGVKPLSDDTMPQLVDLSHVSGFFQQVGSNTKYVIHPEEILADNFAFLILENHHIPSPEIIDKMKKILVTQHATK
jgi:hypothetical protein